MPRGIGPQKSTFQDLTGKTFGSWTVIKRAPNAACGRSMWECKCVCGEVRAVMSSHLVAGRTKSCGCQRPTGTASPRFKHGLSGSSTHNIWMQMHGRCKPTAADAHLYYNKGIQVCERWNDFENFFCDMGPRPSPRHSIGRIDGNAGYEPGNCRWETAKQQANNTSRNKFIVFNGKSLTLAQWAELLGMPYSKLKWRVDNWPLERAFDAAA